MKTPRGNRRTATPLPLAPMKMKQPDSDGDRSDSDAADTSDDEQDRRRPGGRLEQLMASRILARGRGRR